MIAFLEGTVVDKGRDFCLINTNGVGFKILMSTQSLAQLPQMNEQAFIYTYLQVRDDAFVLFGFLSVEEQNVFEKLISVSSVGPKIALAALSSYTPEKIIRYITAQDVESIQAVPGIGKKMASRIVLELKSAFGDTNQGLFDNEGPKAAKSAFASVRDALLTMGFTTDEIELALKDAPEDADESALLKYALKRMGS